MKFARPSVDQQPFRVSITGIDGSGKDGVSQQALTLASHHLVAVKLGHPSFEFTDGEARQIYPRTTTAFDRLYQSADQRDSRSLVVGTKAIHILTQTHILERQVARRNPDIVATSRDFRTDTGVYSGFYLGSLANSISMKRRVSLMQRLTHLKRDLIIHLNVDPGEAVRRIDQRAQEETGFTAMHETIDNLALFEKDYSNALDAIQEIRPATTIVSIDTTHRPIEEVVQATYHTIMDARSGQLPRGARLAA